MAAVVESLERDMELLCLTGVEDKLQDNVRPTLELLRNAGIKVWLKSSIIARDESAYYKILSYDAVSPERMGKILFYCSRWSPHYIK